MEAQEKERRRLNSGQTLVMVAGEGSTRSHVGSVYAGMVLFPKEVCPNLVGTFQWLGSHRVPAPSPAQ